MFQMKDLTLHVQPAGGLLLFPNTCRISGNDPNPGGTVCMGDTSPPHGPGHDPNPKTDPCENSRRPDSDHDRGPRRASDLDALREALRRSLNL
jgi:hypothetical protein